MLILKVIDSVLRKLYTKTEPYIFPIVGLFTDTEL